MAGGMILMGILIAYLPVSAAMVLHGTAQMTSNGWRALLWRRNTHYGIFGRYILGLVAAGVLFTFVGFLPDRALVLISLGIIPFLAVLRSENRRFGKECVSSFSSRWSPKY